MRFPDLVKRVVILSIFAFLIAAAARSVPAYRRSAQLSDFIRDRAVRGISERASASDLKSQVTNYAVSLGLPVGPGDVHVDTHPGSVSIKLDYKVPVSLLLFTWSIRFTPEVESRAY